MRAKYKMYHSIVTSLVQANRSVEFDNDLLLAAQTLEDIDDNLLFASITTVEQFKEEILTTATQHLVKDTSPEHMQAIFNIVLQHYCTVAQLKDATADDFIQFVATVNN